MTPSNKRVPTIRFSGFVEEWKENKVADLAERFYGGGTPSTIASEYWGGETAWIQSSDLGEGELFNVVPKRKVTLKALKETNIQLIPANSIAVVIRVGVGKLALMEYSYTTSQDFCSLANLRANPAMLSYLLYLELNYKGVSVQGTAIKGITKNDLDSINLFIPDGRSEQSRIGQFFRTLDKLIELRKKKLDKLIALKKELLNKLFPQQGQKNPSIRFSGFVEEWRNLTFGDTFCFLKNNTLSRAELVFQGHGAQNIHYGDILIKFGTCLEADKEEIPFIRENNLTNISAASYLREGDIIIADTAEDSAVGKCCEIIGGNNLRLVAGLHTIPGRPQTFFSPAYLGYYLNSPSFHDQLLPLMQGIKVIAISKSAIILTNVRFPSINEQSRIGQFFRTLDKLIELRKKEVDKMTALKKELLNKLFVG